MAGGFPDPLKKTAYIVDADRTPDRFFVRQWNLLLQFVKDTLSDIAGLIARVVRLEAVTISTTTPITGGGSILALTPIAHADSGVVAGAYAHPDLTVDAKGHITAIAAGTGGGWTLIEARNLATSPGANQNFTSLGTYSDILLIVMAGTIAPAASPRVVLVSVNGGASYFNSAGNYKGFSATGITPSNFTGFGLGTDNGVGPYYGFCLLSTININGAVKLGRTNQDNRWFDASLSPINAIRFTSTGGTNINGGTAYLFGR